MRVNAGDMPFEIVDLSRVWVLADAYESDLRHVKVGTSAKLTLKAFPNHTFDGRVAFIDPFLNPKTRTAKVRVEVPNPAGQLKPEMFGEVVFQGRSREGVRIPTDAIIRSGTKSVVFLALGDGKFRPREVQVGEGDASFVEVVSGIEPGRGRRDPRQLPHRLRVAPARVARGALVDGRRARERRARRPRRGRSASRDTHQPAAPAANPPAGEGR